MFTGTRPKVSLTMIKILAGKISTGLTLNPFQWNGMGSLNAFRRGMEGFSNAAQIQMDNDAYYRGLNLDEWDDQL